MPVKDYYTILEVQPGAPLAEIKKSFRRLALQYHPDTTNGNRTAEAWYREIQEAYKTLMDDTLREEYHQQRWLLKTQGKAFTQTIPLTPAFILLQCKAFQAQVAHIDHFRMDHLALQQQILFLLRPECVAALQDFKDVINNRLVIDTIVESSTPLGYPYLPPILDVLYKIDPLDNSIIKAVSTYQQTRRADYLYQKYQIIIILGITMLLCMLIYFVSKK